MKYKFTIIVVWVFIVNFNSYGLVCESLFATIEASKIVDPLKASTNRIEQLHQNYPKFYEKLNIWSETSWQSEFSNLKVNTIENPWDISSNLVSGDRSKFEITRLKNLPINLQKTLVEVYNSLHNKTAFIDYLKTLYVDTAVHMMSRSDSLVKSSKDLVELYPELATEKKVKMQYYLEAGLLERNALLRVLVHRARARGQQFAYILPRVNYNYNKTKSMKFNNFFEVPFHGPFIDGYFTQKSSHGQDTHLIQMDYVADLIFKTTEGNPRIFWDYATRDATWVWDTFFDATDGSLRHPEYLGPKIQKYFPVY